MRNFGIFCIISLLLIIIVMPLRASTSADLPAVQDNGSQAPAPVLQPSDVWIVVNLFTGRTSKQAVKVMDTLDELGAGGRGMVLPYREITVERMAELRPRFLALSPNGIPWCRYRGKNGVDLQNFFRALRVVVEDMYIPVIGICGGHQALALAFGGKVGPIRGGEDDCLPYGDNPTERGRHYVTLLKQDPIFLGMPDRINMVQNHYDEVKRIPPGFINLAENKMCPCQLMRHPTRPAYGVQAHSEYYYGSRPHGGMLLRNFLRLAQAHNRAVRGPRNVQMERILRAEAKPISENREPLMQALW